ncbi:MAG: hypothetical protein WD898_02685 [Candidatus Paceibacterota bacterium]
MALAIKTLFIVLIAAVVGGFVLNRAPELKQKVIETINPVAKERRLLGELTLNLDALSSSVDSLSGSSDNPDFQTKIASSKDLVQKSKELLKSLTESKQDSGIIKSQVGKIIDSLIDKTPFPADHLQSKESSTPLVCPPVTGS